MGGSTVGSGGGATGGDAPGVGGAETAGGGGTSGGRDPGANAPGDVAAGEGSDWKTPGGGQTGAGNGNASVEPQRPAIIDAIVDLLRPKPAPGAEPVKTPSVGAPDPVDAPAAPATNSGADLLKRIADAVRTNSPALAPAPVMPAVTPEVVAPAVDPAPVARRVAAREPATAATAPRIAFSSGGQGAPQFRSDMVLALGMDARTRQLVGALGFRIVAERRSALLGNAMVVKLRTPRDVPATRALAELRRLAPQVTFDYASLYRPTGGPVPVRYAADLIGAPAPRSCPIEARIGLIDTGVGRHQSLGSATIVQSNFVAGKPSMNVAHGTAIASILVGDLPGVGPLAPGAALYSANVFEAEGKALRADALAIIEALDWMASQRVKVVNLSLMGPPNALLEKAVLASAQRGQILIAAAGNDGAEGPPAYPAAYPGVIAVAAVDSRGRPYARNNRGSYVEISAPGVDVWGADARGGEAFWTGTSFAAPYVTAAVARDVAQGRVSNINDSRARLRASARDMGAPGRDPIYGSGLLQFGGCSGSGSTTISAKGG